MTQVNFPSTYTFEHWGTPGKSAVHFLHANSFCASMYHDFLSPLFPDYDVWALEIPGHGKSDWPGTIDKWEDLADYFIDYLDTSEIPKPLMGIGHSIGGVVTLFAAVMRPDLFSNIILLDPVILPAKILMKVRLARFFHFEHASPLIQKAKRRKRSFPDREAAIDHYRKKRAFRDWQPGIVEAYVDGGFKTQSNGSLEISCAPELEASIYRSLPTNVRKYEKKLHTPTLVLAGKNSDTLFPVVQHRLKKLEQWVKVEQVPGSHLFPFENPGAAMEQILEFIK